MDYSYSLEEILFTNSPKEKIEKFKCFYDKFRNNDFIFNNFYVPYEFDKPSYHSFSRLIIKTLSSTISI